MPAFPVRIDIADQHASGELSMILSTESELNVISAQDAGRIGLTAPHTPPAALTDRCGERFEAHRMEALLTFTDEGGNPHQVQSEVYVAAAMERPVTSRFTLAATPDCTVHLDNQFQTARMALRPVTA